MRRFLWLIPVVLVACTRDESVRAYGGADRVWVLEEMGGEPYAGRATLEFEPGDGITGETPCGPYRAVMAEPYPWFRVTGWRADTQPCESRFAAAMADMELVETQGDILILSDADGYEMVFRAGG